jgi:hypothetical protein
MEIYSRSSTQSSKETTESKIASLVSKEATFHTGVILSSQKDKECTECNQRHPLASEEFRHPADLFEEIQLYILDRYTTPKALLDAWYKCRWTRRLLRRFFFHVHFLGFLFLEEDPQPFRKLYLRIIHLQHSSSSIHSSKRDSIDSSKEIIRSNRPAVLDKASSVSLDDKD